MFRDVGQTLGDNILRVVDSHGLVADGPPVECDYLRLRGAVVEVGAVDFVVVKVDLPFTKVFYFVTTRSVRETHLDRI
jgi:hypothetical protein